MGAIFAGKSNRNTPQQLSDSANTYERVKAFLSRQGSGKILGSEKQFQDRYKRNASVRQVVANIDEVERRINEARAPSNRLQTLINKMITGGKRVEFKDNAINIELADHNKLPLEALSSGEKHVLRIFVAAVKCSINTLLIDEPELSMHVDWQSELVQSLRILAPNVQLILATHSPEIMGPVSDSHIFRL